MAAALVLLALLAPAVMAESSVMKHLSSSQFTGFMKLLEHADLVPELESALKSGKGLTIFAPTDDALMYHTSPTLLAFLKLAENKETLRKVLMSHIVAERLSAFQWEGAHKTLAGSHVDLSMDAQAFYAANVAIMQYNALVGSDASVHSVPTLIIPSSLASSAQMFVEDAADVRRVLAATGPVGSPAAGPEPSKKPDNIKGASSKAMASICTVFLAAAAALLF